jgi:hypothetical protein
MSKLILKVTAETVDGLSARVNAVFDPGSFYTIIRESYPQKMRGIKYGR